MSDPTNIQAPSVDCSTFIADAEALHGAIITTGYLSLPEPEKAKLAPFVQAMFAYWDAGKGADPSEVLKQYPAAKATFEQLRKGRSVVAADEMPKEPKPTRPPDAAPPSAIPAAEPIKVGTLVAVDASTLTPHPINAKLFANVGNQDQEAFEQDVAANGVQKSLLVAGDGCASPRGTIYAGSRRCAAAIKAGLKVTVIYRDGLSEDEEVGLVIHDNLADQHARKLTHEQRFNLEEELRVRHGKRQGQRTDLQTSPTGQVDLDGDPAKSRRAPKTVEEIARRANQSPNAVAQRQKVFGSKITPPSLKAQVNDGVITISAAANMVRAVEMEYGEELDDLSALQRAHAKLDAQVRMTVEAKGDGKKKKSNTKKKRPSTASPKNGKPPAAAPASSRHQQADTTASAMLRAKMRKRGIYTPDFFDTFEAAAEDVMAFVVALQVRIARVAAGVSMDQLKELNAGRDPRTFPPSMPPEWKRILVLHRLVSKTLMPVVSGKVRRRFVKMLKVLAPFGKELAPESIPPGAEQPS